MIYDIIILGAAPAGLTAALYGSRQGNKVLVIEKEKEGGQAASTNLIENYPGTEIGIKGPELVDLMVRQAEEFGAEIVIDRIEKVDLKPDIKIIKTHKKEYKAKSVIIATGASPRKLGIVGEKEFTGKGIAYCATCDAPFFEGLDIYVVGGGNSAVDEAIYLTKFGRKVTIIHRRDKLKADAVSQEAAFNNKKIDFIWNSEVIEFRGEGLLKSFVLRDTVTGDLREIKVDPDQPTFGVFIYVGNIPSTDLFEGQLKLEDSYIVTDEDMRTEIKGVYAAGDVRKKTLRQVVTAAADGAIAAFVAGKELKAGE
ncbi:MAG: thioredoxin-disulfide reductase [Tissierellia bacterium]|nr:thioredoxin-disulfide reductase [Tissierellia bacterium]